LAKADRIRKSRDDGEILIIEAHARYPFSIHPRGREQWQQQMQTAYRLNIDKAHICGMSMGGMIAQTFAINNPSRTLSLISIYSSSGRKEIGPTQELEKLKVIDALEEQLGDHLDFHQVGTVRLAETEKNRSTLEALCSRARQEGQMIFGFPVGAANGKKFRRATTF